MVRASGPNIDFIPSFLHAVAPGHGLVLVGRNLCPKQASQLRAQCRSGTVNNGVCRSRDGNTEINIPNDSRTAFGTLDQLLFQCGPVLRYSWRSHRRAPIHYSILERLRGPGQSVAHDASAKESLVALWCSYNLRLSSRVWSCCNHFRVHARWWSQLSPNRGILCQYGNSVEDESLASTTGNTKIGAMLRAEQVPHLVSVGRLGANAASPVDGTPNDSHSQHDSLVQFISGMAEWLFQVYDYS